jgi:hypothetical protein
LEKQDLSFPWLQRMEQHLLKSTVKTTKDHLYSGETFSNNSESNERNQNWLNEFGNKELLLVRYSFI